MATGLKGIYMMKMKLKILPPTLRNPKRYLVFEAISQIPLTHDNVISLIREASLCFHGECGVSYLDLWIMKIWRLDSPEHENVVKGIIQCNREQVNPIRASLLTITKFKGSKVVFHTIGISGTIKSAIKKFIKPDEQENKLVNH